MDGARLSVFAERTGAAARPRLLVAEELTHALHRLVLRVHRVQDTSARQRIAGEEPLVEDLPAPEGAPRHIPGEPEELDPVAGRRRVGGQVLLDVRGQRALEVRLAWRDQEATRSEELEDLE